MGCRQHPPLHLHWSHLKSTFLAFKFWPFRPVFFCFDARNLKYDGPRWNASGDDQPPKGDARTVYTKNTQKSYIQKTYGGRTLNTERQQQQQLTSSSSNRKIKSDCVKNERTTARAEQRQKQYAYRPMYWGKMSQDLKHFKVSQLYSGWSLEKCPGRKHWIGTADATDFSIHRSLQSLMK